MIEGFSLLGECIIRISTFFQGHISNRERKALAKAERKERRREEKGHRKTEATTVKSDLLGATVI